MKLGDRIRKIREANNLTQSQIADYCNITSSAYGQIERKANNSTFETLSKIAKAINVSVSFLVDLENPDYIQNNKL
jgi:transcriptional regulator with XRE-family HTH domain